MVDCNTGITIRLKAMESVSIPTLRNSDFTRVTNSLCPNCPSMSNYISLH